jgi:hypothetical protein
MGEVRVPSILRESKPFVKAKSPDIIDRPDRIC